MDALRYFYADDWTQSRPVISPAVPGPGTTEVPIAPVFRNMVLDTTVHISPWTHPAIVVNMHPEEHVWHVCGARTLGALYGTDPAYLGTEPLDPLLQVVPTFMQRNTLGAPSVAWRPLFNLFAYTQQAGDAIEFTTNAQQISIRLVGYTAAGQGLQAGMEQGPNPQDPLDPSASDPLQAAHIRNGALVTILVDGEPLEVVNTWHHNPVANVFLMDGDPHTITVVNSGQHDPAFHPISRLHPLYTVPTATPSRPNSLYVTLAVSPLQTASFIRASWRAVALSGTTWRLYRTLPGGSETLVADNLPTGVHFDDLVPGANLYVATTEPLVVAGGQGDSVTFTTDVLQMGIQWIEFGWGDSLGPCCYTAAPVFVEADDVQFFLAEWFENEVWGSFSVEAGHIDSDGTVRWEPAYTVPTAQTSQTWTLGFAGTPTGGTFRLSFRGQTTGPITYSTTAATTASNIQTALGALSTVGTGDITVTAQSPTLFTLTGAGTLGGQYLPDIGVDPAQMLPVGTTATVVAPALSTAVHIQDTALDADTNLPGTNVGHAGLMEAPRGQYVRWTLCAPSFAAALPYARDLSLYYWPPERDLVMVTKMPLGEDIVLGPALNAFTGTLETFLCNTYFDAGRLMNGATVLGATDEYLALYGQDLGLPQYLGEPPQGYRRRLAAAFSSGQDGGSMPFIASRLAELVFGQVQDPVVRSSSDLSIDPEDVMDVAAVCAEAVPVGPDAMGDPPVLVARQVEVYRDASMPQAYWIVMPPMNDSWPYQGLPQVPPAQVKHIVERYLLDILNPVAAVVDYLYTNWHITWGF